MAHSAASKRIKPTHKAIKAYYAALEAFAHQSVDHEMAVRSAFQTLLADCGRTAKWTLIPEQSASVKIEGKAAGIRPDGTFRDDYYINRGYWEAKDTADNLEAEVRKKTKLGYSLVNTIFEDTRAALLFQNGDLSMRADLTNPQQLADLLNAFFSHTEPEHEDFEKAVDDFKERVPDLAKGLVEKIADAHKNNDKFQKAFDGFFELCKSSLNPNLSAAAVDEMLVQHILTERLIRTIFDNEDFMQRNVIAAEVEKVLGALFSKSINRKEHLKSLDRFYVAIENAAKTIPSFTEKQHFLNTVYERFFQGYSVKVADTHGIVYTPQPIVDFMCASVVEVLEKEFGKTLGDKDVFILDPCTGTGNFIVNLLRRIPHRNLPDVYKHRLFANEIMLLPYYIAALNIEHAYYELTKEYEPFEGLCFVDTLDIAEHSQGGFDFFTEKNTERVQRQRKSPITVIVGNPPYNANQTDENDNNKNRRYDQIDTRLRNTYVKDSTASLRNKVYDPYLRFFRWASDRIGKEGIVVFVSNNQFVDGVAFDGVRKHLVKDFNHVLILDLKGNVRKDSMREGKPIGEENTVFGLAAMVGIAITVLIRNPKSNAHKLCYAEVDWRSTRTEKFRFIAQHRSICAFDKATIQPDKQGHWLRIENEDAFANYLPVASKEVKASTPAHGEAIFKSFSLGVGTNRDEWAYAFSDAALSEKMERCIHNYNYEVFRLSQVKKLPKNLDAFVNNDPTFIKWTDRLKAALANGNTAEFFEDRMRGSLYRPFAKRRLYFDPLFNQRRYQQHRIFPTGKFGENALLEVGGYGRKEFAVLATDLVPDLNFYADPAQCLPFYIYDEDGSNRRENITDWALKQFRTRYGGTNGDNQNSLSLSLKKGEGRGEGSRGQKRRTAAPSPQPSPSTERERESGITKWDIFHYLYGMLHHPGYRTKFADNLKRELPRIPFADSYEDFIAFRDAGKKLMDLHLNYEKVKEWPLKWIEAKGVPLDYGVEKMKLSKDKQSLRVNESLTLGDIPPEVFEYRLGNRSALEWVIDQYQVSTDKRSGIVSDPNRKDDPEYIVRLVGQVTRVSVDTVAIVKCLPQSYGSGLAEMK